MSCGRPTTCPPRASGRMRRASTRRSRRSDRRSWRAPKVPAPIRVAVAGAAGRMGQTVCRAVEAAPDMELTGRADPALNTPLADVLKDADVLVDFTIPPRADSQSLNGVRPFLPLL